MFYVLSNPEVHAKLRAEVDAVVGQERMRPEHLPRLPYMTAVMRETMRLKSTIPLFMVTPFEDEVIGGKYLIKKGTNIMVGVTNIHRDKEVYGEDVCAYFLFGHAWVLMRRTAIGGGVQA